MHYFLAFCLRVGKKTKTGAFIPILGAFVGMCLCLYACYLCSTFICKRRL